jgi:hypothetical protein
MQPEAAKYLKLIRAFNDGAIPLEQFERNYFRMHKAERVLIGPPVDRILGTLFSDLDSFEPDPALRAELNEDRPGFYLNEQEIRVRIRLAQAELEAVE